MTKKTKISPDEEFSLGPFNIKRFGKINIFQSNLSEDDLKKIQKTLLESYPKIVVEIDDLVANISKIVAINSPEQLMQRAYSELALSHLDNVAEFDLSPEQILSMRMVDYIQSIIASVKPKKMQKEDLSDEDWKSLKDKVEKLFQKINQDYTLSSSAKRKEEDSGYNLDKEEFYISAQLHWCNVRAEQYHVHQIQALEDILLPQDEQIQKIYRISSHELTKELKKIWHSLIFGLVEAIEEVENFRQQTLSIMMEKKDTDFNKILNDKQKDQGQAAFQKMFGMDIFDLEKITNLPQPFLDDFSWKPGEEEHFFSEGDFKGWPLRVWPTFTRPFLKLNEKYYCFDLHSLCDHFYRQLEKKVFSHPSKIKQKWISVRKETSESLPAKYLTKLLPNAEDYGEVYYQWKTGKDKKLNWCETDRLIKFDDTLFIIEVKAGSFTWTSPATHFDAYIKSIETLVQAPSEQGDRFLEYLQGDKQVDIFEKDGSSKKFNKIATLKKSDFTRIIKCAVTLDPFTEIAAKSQHLKKINIETGNVPVWSISIDDLRVFSDIFDNELEFIHFVEQRSRALKSVELQLDDEMDHVGLYLQHNDYALYAKNMTSANHKPRLQFQGYRTKIDDFFHEKLENTSSSTSLTQSMPDRLREIIQWLANSNQTGRAALSCYLLDSDEESRNKIFKSIDPELQFSKENRRTRPLSSHGEFRLTICSSIIPIVPRKVNTSKKHTMAIMLMNNEENRYLLEPVYSEQNKLISLSWEEIRKADIPDKDLPQLQMLVDKIKNTRIQNIKKTSGKIGRNDRCPCGSGKKYKRCCIE